MVQDKGSAAKWDKELHQLQFMLKILERNPTFVDMPSKSPQLWHQLLQYKKGLLRNIDICNWDLDELGLGDEEKDKIAVYSCDDLSTLSAVYERKQRIYNLLLATGSDWGTQENEGVLARTQNLLIQYFTKLTDYLINERYPVTNIYIPIRREEA